MWYIWIYPCLSLCVVLLIRYVIRVQFSPYVWIKSRNCGCLVIWFCYHLIAKPGNKTATVPWPDTYMGRSIAHHCTHSCPPPKGASPQTIETLTTTKEGTALNTIPPNGYKTNGYKANMLYSHDDVIKWEHFPRYWPFVRGIHRSPVNSPHKGQWRGTLMFPLIYAWMNRWVNNRGAGDLRRHRAHYGVSVMMTSRRSSSEAQVLNRCIQEDLCASSRFQGQGKVITGQSIFGM